VRDEELSFKIVLKSQRKWYKAYMRKTHAYKMLTGKPQGKRSFRDT
jgi:uncharacterized C2H2 Zn-finger protein